MKKKPFGSVRVLVVGDVMLDRYCFGEVNRISPEAPVPIVKVQRETSGPGGAANVAHNIARLGALATLIGMAGRDGPGRELARLAGKAGIAAHFVADAFATTTKTRIIGAHQQMLRLDVEEYRPPGANAVRGLIRTINRSIRDADIVILSDYGKGVCGDRVCRAVLAAAKKRRLPVVVDPKAEDWSTYAGADFISPNVKELSMAAGRTVPNEDARIETAARELLVRYRLGHLLVTRSEKGLSLISGNRSLHMRSRAQEVFDVSGAGDTVVATFAVAHAAGLPIDASLSLANAAAGIVVAKIGTCPVELHELETAARSLHIPLR
jgi:D-beta-D-heptose 7-phosphate kinase/D-beta-D-heptose 1-phosphate adenosyltransferase